MSALLLRSIRFRTSLLLEPGELCEHEFTDRQSGSLDRNLSVYAITQDQVHQTHAEVHAGLLKEPDLRASSVDVKPPADSKLVATLGDTKFPFTIAAHHEIQVTSDDAVRAIAASVHANIPGCEVRPNYAAMRSHVRERIHANDPHWDACLNLKPKWKKWSGETEVICDGCPRMAKTTLDAAGESVVPKGWFQDAGPPVRYRCSNCGKFKGTPKP